MIKKWKNCASVWGTGAGINLHQYEENQSMFFFLHQISAFCSYLVQSKTHLMNLNFVAGRKFLRLCRRRPSDQNITLLTMLAWNLLSFR